MTGSSEQGRSMVEMLGVLAIIGILSVAGIAGYSNAMNKHKANTLIQEAQKRAVVVAGQIQMTGKTPSLDEFTNNDFGYGQFGTGVYTKENNLPDGQFGIKVENVSKEVCQNILKTIGENSVIRRLATEEAPATAITTCGDDNTFLVVYNNDMSTGAVAGEFGYENCPESFYQCATTNACVATQNDCPSICALEQELSSGCVCPEHRDRTGGVCGECVDVETYETWEQPILTNETGNGLIGVDDFACTASSEIDWDRQAWRAFDNSNEDDGTGCWHSNDEYESWISWYTQNPIKINSITITNRDLSSFVTEEDCLTYDTAIVKDFQLQYSDDNSNWSEAIYTGINPQGCLRSTTFDDINASSAHRYWRLYITSNHSYDNNYITIGELSIDADELISINYELDSSGRCVVANE